MCIIVVICGQKLHASVAVVPTPAPAPIPCQLALECHIYMMIMVIKGKAGAVHRSPDIYLIKAEKSRNTLAKGRSESCVSHCLN